MSDELDKLRKGLPQQSWESLGEFCQGKGVSDKTKLVLGEVAGKGYRPPTTKEGWQEVYNFLLEHELIEVEPDRLTIEQYTTSQTAYLWGSLVKRDDVEKRQKEGKHTPGPWECFYKHKYDEWHVSLPNPGTNMRMALFPDGVPSPEKKEAEANARLIAAAPELLEACTALLVLAENIERYAVEIDSIRPDLQQAISMGQRAISKARGDSTSVL